MPSEFKPPAVRLLEQLREQKKKETQTDGELAAESNSSNALPCAHEHQVAMDGHPSMAELQANDTSADPAGCEAEATASKPKKRKRAEQPSSKPVDAVQGKKAYQPAADQALHRFFGGGNGPSKVQEVTQANATS